MSVVYWPRHVLSHCDPRCNGCILCHGGLALCRVCGGMEGSLPTDCPGAPMQEEVEHDVYARKTDYRRGEGWVEKQSRAWEGFRCR